VSKKVDSGHYGSPTARIATSRFVEEAVNWTSPRDTDDQLLALWFIKNQHKALRPARVVYSERSKWAVPSRLHGVKWSRNRPGS
jgi:hypothetical protein